MSNSAQYLRFSVWILDEVEIKEEDIQLMTEPEWDDNTTFHVLAQIVPQVFPELKCILCKSNCVTNEDLGFQRLRYSKNRRLVLVPYCSTNESCLARARQVLRQFLRFEKKLYPSLTIACPICHQSVSKLLRCGRCGYVGYCSATCQKVGWPNHKKTCQAPPNKLEDVD